MIPTYRMGLLAGAATLACTGVVCAQDAQSEAVSRELATLRAELADLKAQSGDKWLTEARAAEIRSLVQDVLADADTRSSLQGSGMTAGWDNGFFLASPDGNYRLNVQGEIQFRYMMNFRESAADQDDTTKGFENAATRLIFSGNVVDRTWKYRVQGNFANTDSSSSGGFGLEDAWLQKDFDNGFYVRAGQFRGPFLREDLVRESRQLLVDRSVLSNIFSTGYTQGVELGWEGDWIRAGFMFSDGAGSLVDEMGNPRVPRGSANTPSLTPTTEWAFTARAEVKVAGDWRQFDDFTSWNGESFGLLIGAAINWEREEFGGADPSPKAAPLSVTVDASAEFGGANLYGAFVYRDTDTENSGSNDQWGFMVQGGVFVVPDTFEVFGRYEWADLDITGVDDVSILTLGVNWYFAKHSAKWTTDFGYSFKSMNLVEPNGQFGSTGWLGDAGTNDDQFLIRSQFQLLF
jgi:phosphate-selective porin OprO/OprP